MSFSKNPWLLLLAALLISGCASKEVKMRQATARSNAQALQSENRQPDLYRIGPGDGLRIDFLENDELNRGVLVRPDGYISLPLVGDIKVSEKTLPEVRELIGARYKGVLKNPTIATSVESIGGKIYVGGEVASPGAFILNDGVTAMRAIALAGGAKYTAGLRSVLVIRDQGTLEPKYLMIDLRAGGSELDPHQDVRLHPKDVVLVPKSRIAKADQFVDQYFNQLIPFQKNVGVTYLYGKPAL